MFGTFRETGESDNLDGMNMRDNVEEQKNKEYGEGSDKLKRLEPDYSYKPREYSNEPKGDYKYVHPEPSEKPKGDFSYKPSEHGRMEDWGDWDSTEDDPTVHKKVLARRR